MRKELFCYFTRGEILLWCVSAGTIILSFLLLDREHILTLAASLLGVTSLLFNAKGNPFGQLLMIIFSLFYGFISYTCSYYGEMITYLGMTAPMAFFALLSWLKNPYNGNRAEVAVNRIHRKECIFIIFLTAVVTSVFYFILDACHTANIIMSTASIATSFLAVYLTFRRSACFAVAYAANDLILILLWSLASRTDSSYLSVMICFVMFLVNDIYGFISWSGMQKRQEAAERTHIHR